MASIFGHGSCELFTFSLISNVVYIVIPMPDTVLVAAVLVIVSSQTPKSLLLAGITVLLVAGVTVLLVAGITVLLVAVVFPDFYVTFHIPIPSLDVPCSNGSSW